MRRGFTLIELLVGLTVTAMMMVQLITLVSYAGDVWQRSSITVSLAAEGDTLLDAIEMEMGNSFLVSSPGPGDNATHTLCYVKVQSDYQGTPVLSSFSFRIDYATPTPTVFFQIQTNDTLWTTAGGNGWASSTTTGVKKVVMRRHDFDIARHVLDLRFTRPSQNLLHVWALLGLTRERDGLERSLVVERSLILP